MKNPLNISIILGTARAGNASGDVWRFVVDYLQNSETEADFQPVDVADYLFSRTYEAWNDHDDVAGIADWKKIADAADGFIIVVPEYNHGYPGELKILLDAAFREYFDKPVLLVGVSAGGFGGARVVELIKPTLLELGMTPMGRAVYVSKVGEVFSETGEITTEGRERYSQQLEEAIAPLLRYAQAFRGLRAAKDEDAAGD
jgi:NAD(P)H-dependent FMN reductase